MPKWTEYKASALERGALAFELYMVRSMPTADMPLMQKTLPAHLAYPSKNGTRRKTGPCRPTV